MGDCRSVRKVSACCFLSCGCAAMAGSLSDDLSDSDTGSDSDDDDFPAWGRGKPSPRGGRGGVASLRGRGGATSLGGRGGGGVPRVGRDASLPVPAATTKTTTTTAAAATVKAATATAAAVSVRPPMPGPGRSWGGEKGFIKCVHCLTPTLISAGLMSMHVANFHKDLKELSPPPPSTRDTLRGPIPFSPIFLQYRMPRAVSGAVVPFSCSIIYCAPLPLL